MELEKELQQAKNLAVKAGHAIMEIYEQDYNIEYKKDQSPLTIADKQSNMIIVI